MMKLILPVTCIVVLRKHGPRCITLSRAKKERRRYFTCAAASDRHQLMCLLTSLVISNMLTLDLPPKTFFSLSSALIWRRFFWSCRLCFLMYTQRFLVIWPRGMALVPTISASVTLGLTGITSEAHGLRALFLTDRKSTRWNYRY